MIKNRIQLNEAVPSYDEDYMEMDFMPESLNEGAPTYIEDYMPMDFGIEEDYDADDAETSEISVDLTEDLDSSFPVRLMSEGQVRSAAAKVFKGAKVRFGYVNSLKLAANYAQGKFSKKDNVQYPLVRAIRVSETRACTGVKYNNTEGAKLLHSTQQYQDKLAARIAAGKGGFGTNVHDTEAGLENTLVTTATGLKCILAYPLSNGKVHSTYYISIDGEDWRATDKTEIAKYMTPADADKLLHPETNVAKKAEYQSQVRNNAGQSTFTDSFTVRDINTNEKLKLMTNPMNITYLDPNNKYKGVFALDKESAVVEDTPEIAAETDPLDQDFPEVE